MLTLDHLQAILNYDLDTGLFTNRVRRGARGMVGVIAGHFDKDGYIIIQINGTKYRSARLAWFYITGEWPIEVDHKDGVRSNNAWLNLREATRSDNVANSNRETGISGLRGVKQDPKNPTLWRARVSYGNYRVWLGPYSSAEEAHAAYLCAVEATHGEFALHNRPSEKECA